MPTRRRTDLVNLHEALCDTLVHHKVVKDDNSGIIVSMDGSRVLYDKENPRTEITITAVADE
jgi:Holliday junction resolvase RusA-like endonuclease